jgi:hypothetical protein
MPSPSRAFQWLRKPSDGHRLLARGKISRRSVDLIPGVLLLCISAAMLSWSLPRLKQAFLGQENFVPTTHISVGSDCEFGQRARIEFNVDARMPTTFTLALLDIAAPSPSHPCEYIYIRFPGRINKAYADKIPNPMSSTEFKEDIYVRVPGQRPQLGNALLDASVGDDVRLTVAIKKLSEHVRSGDLYIKGQLSTFLYADSSSERVLHYWIRLPGSQIRQGCQTDAECEDDYITDNPHLGVIDLIFSRDLGIKSVLLIKSAEALTRDGKARITTEDLTGSIVIEDKENARSRDVVVLYAGALFAAAIAVLIDGVMELLRFALRSDRSR